MSYIKNLCHFYNSVHLCKKTSVANGSIQDIKLNGHFFHSCGNYEYSEKGSFANCSQRKSNTVPLQKNALQIFSHLIPLHTIMKNSDLFICWKLYVCTVDLLKVHKCCFSQQCIKSMASS